MPTLEPMIRLTHDARDTFLDAPTHVICMMVTTSRVVSKDNDDYRSRILNIDCSYKGHMFTDITVEAGECWNVAMTGIWFPESLSRVESLGQVPVASGAQARNVNKIELLYILPHNIDNQHIFTNGYLCSEVAKRPSPQT